MFELTMTGFRGKDCKDENFYVLGSIALEAAYNRVVSNYLATRI